MTTETILSVVLGVIVVATMAAIIIAVVALITLKFGQSLRRAYRHSRQWLGSKIIGQCGERSAVPQRSKYAGPENISDLKIPLIEKAEEIQIPHYFRVSYSHILVAAALKGEDVSSYHVMIEKSNELIEVPLYAYRAVRKALARFCQPG